MAEQRLSQSRWNSGKLCKLEVPAKYKDDYWRLLAKHRQIFSLNKNNIRYCDTILHKLFVKTQELVYVKQFKIPKANQHYLQESGMVETEDYSTFSN
jgi:hypothetical protein